LCFRFDTETSNSNCDNKPGPKLTEYPMMITSALANDNHAHCDVIVTSFLHANTVAMWSTDQQSVTMDDDDDDDDDDW